MRLGQILLNLVNNALKFTEKGHILLVVEVAQAHQCSNNQSTNNQTNDESKSICLQFSITDTGIGIKKEDINKLFNSFTQADNSTTRKFGGTGLGLSISKQLIELMDGQIKVESKYGQGSTFSFGAKFLIESEAEKTVYTIPAKIQHTHVLVIDDNQIAQSIFQKMLDCFGFRISLASSAKEGIELLKQYSTSNPTLNPAPDPIKLILMDWKMPEMDGIEATEIIKTQLDLEIIPTIILVTAHANIENSKEIQVLWDDYLVKPVSQSILYDSIVTIFSERQSKKSSIRGSAAIRKSVHAQVNDLSDKKVLLTEDNKTNQEVACALMGEFKLQVSIANNGKEAVDAIKSTDFDLIFMDLQMPEMDGFEATSIIRADKQYKHIPIIAMTAHAMQGDRQKCLDAQMDDYITKPIDVEKFFAMLNKWLGAESENFIATQELSSIATLPTLEAINTEKALLRVRNNKELLLRLLMNFKKQKFDMAEKISEAIIHNDLKSAKELVHSLKGESGTLEANTLHKQTIEFEQYLLEKQTSLENNMIINDEQNNSYLIKLTKSLNHVLTDISYLETEFKKESKLSDVNNSTIESKNKTIDIESLNVQFQELSELLQDNNLRAKTLAKTMSADLTSSLYSEPWDKLLKALSDLDFEYALKVLIQLAKDLGIPLQDMGNE